MAKNKMSGLWLTGKKFTPTRAGSVAIAAAVLPALMSQAATYTPISLLSSSFNQDVVVEATAPQSGAANNITASMDQGTVNKNNNVWMEKGYYAANTSVGLPVSGSTFTSQNDSSHIFTMQGYGTSAANNNNVMFIGANGGVASGTMSFSSNQTYSAFSVLWATSNGPATMSATVNYANGTTQTIANLLAPDWFGSGEPIAYATGGRTDPNVSSGSTFDVRGNGYPDLFQTDFTVTDTADPITSITFGSTNKGSTSIFALSGVVAASTVYFSGSVNGNFDTGTTNFTTADGGGTAVAFTSGNAVVFDDFGSTGTINVTGGGVTPSSITFNNNSRAYTFGNGALNVSGSATFNGSSSVTFNNAATFAGGTTINAGTITIGSAGSFNSSSVNLASGASFNFQSGAKSSAPFVLTGSGTINVNGTALTVSGTTNFTGTFAGTGGSLNISGGTFNAGNSTQYAGLTNGITVGTGTTASYFLVNDNSTTAGAGIPLTIGSNGTLGTPTGASNIYYTGPITLAANVSSPATIAIDGGNFTLPGNITGTGSLSLAGSNNGSFYLGGTNTYAGNTILAGDPARFAPDTVGVVLNSDGGFSPNGGLVINTANPGYLNVDLNGHNPTVQFLSGNSNQNYQIVNNGPGPSTITITNVNNSTGTATFGTTITGNIALLKSGTTGNQILVGNNTYGGGTNISGGTLTVGASTALGSGPVTLSGGTLAFSGASLSSFTTQGGGFTPTVSGGVLKLTNGGTHENTSAFLSSPIPVTAATNLTISYTYTANDPANPQGYIADGAALVIQNDSRGAGALGGGGGSVGYGPSGQITNSLAAGYNLYTYDFGGGGGGDLQFGTNGTFSQFNTSGETLTTQSVNVVFSYNASSQTATETLTGANGHTATFTYAANLFNLLGGSQAYIGFTGGTGDGAAQQLISNLSVSVNGNTLANAPVPISNPINTTANTSSTILVSTSPSNTGEVVGAINISSGSKITLTSTGGNSSSRAVLVTPLLTFLPTPTGGAYTGILDLGRNDLDLTNNPSLTTITGLVSTGYNLKGGANWAGPGIDSSAAGANTSHLTALGVISNNPNGGPQLYGTGTTLGLFDGYSPSSGDVLVKYTYFGDANLDGKVDGSDYSLIDSGYAAKGGLSGWYNGDFNYDGVVDGSDYTLIDNAFNNQVGVLGSGGAGAAALVATSTAQAAGPTAVPEPASIGLIAVVATGLTGRRRRR